jgi:hypothetical protein
MEKHLWWPMLVETFWALSHAPKNDRFPVCDLCRQRAEVAQTAGLNCLFFGTAVASSSAVSMECKLAGVFSPEARHGELLRAFG